MLTLLRSMLEHRLGEDTLHIYHGGTETRLTFQGGNYYVIKDGYITMVDINSYGEWFTDDLIDAVLAIGI